MIPSIRKTMEQTPKITPGRYRTHGDMPRGRLGTYVKKIIDNISVFTNWMMKRYCLFCLEDAMVVHFNKLIKSNNPQEQPSVLNWKGYAPGRTAGLAGCLT
jgi:hypothetical protein